MPWINEGIRAYDEDVATKEDIDTGMELGTNVPMGPLTLADHIGLDVCLHASKTLHEELGDRYKPAYLLKRKVEAGDPREEDGQRILRVRVSHSVRFREITSFCIFPRCLRRSW